MKTITIISTEYKFKGEDHNFEENEALSKFYLNETTKFCNNKEFDEKGGFDWVLKLEKLDIQYKIPFKKRGEVKEEKYIELFEVCKKAGIDIPENLLTHSYSPFTKDVQYTKTDNNIYIFPITADEYRNSFNLKSHLKCLIEFADGIFPDCKINLLLHYNDYDKKTFEVKNNTNGIYHLNQETLTERKGLNIYLFSHVNNCIINYLKGKKEAIHQNFNIEDLIKEIEGNYLGYLIDRLPEIPDISLQDLKSFFELKNADVNSKEKQCAIKIIQEKNKKISLAESYKEIINDIISNIIRKG